jgi:hypothetical protein
LTQKSLRENIKIVENMGNLKAHITKKKVLILSTLILITVFVIFHEKIIRKTKLLFFSLPTSYQTCKLSPYTKDRYIDELKCTISIYSDNFLYEKCKENNGAISHIDCFGDLQGKCPQFCEISYYNPSFVFPDSYENCARKLKSLVNSEKELCKIRINSNYAYDKTIADELVEKCKAIGGSSDNTRDKVNVCSKSFFGPSWKDPLFKKPEIKY